MFSSNDSIWLVLDVIEVAGICDANRIVNMSRRRDEPLVVASSVRILHGASQENKEMGVVRG